MTVATPTAQVPLAARGLCAGYGQIPVLRDLDLEVHRGTVTSLLGRNGAGKSTTLLALAGQLPALAGHVEWLGEPVSASLPALAKRGLAYIPEGRSVFEELTVADNLRLGQGPSARAIELFPELAQHLGRRAGNLSGGQKQMLALARALASDPTVLLADELSLGLAPLVVDRVLAAVRAAADRGVAVLLVEQHVRLALSIADRGYVVDRGRVVLEGSGDELLAGTADIERMYLEGVGAPGEGS